MTETELGFYVRQTALALAVELAAGTKEDEVPKILQVAKIFEQYLMGYKL